MSTIAPPAGTGAPLPTASTGAAGAAAATAANTPAKKPRNVKPKEGVLVNVRIPQKTFDTLKAAGEKDYRDVPNMLIVGGIKFAKSLDEGGSA